MVNRRAQLKMVAPAASPAEAAAVVAALERFMRDTAAARPPPAGAADNPWQRAALLEATGREAAQPSPWGDAIAWGRS